MDHMDQIIYRQIPPHEALSPYIDAFWTVTGDNEYSLPDKILPDGCVDIILNSGPAFTTEQGTFQMDCGRAYLIGTMTRYKEMIRPPGTRLTGVRFKPGGFGFFYDPSLLKDIADKTVEFDKKFVPDMDRELSDLPAILNRWFGDRLSRPPQQTLTITQDIARLNGRITVDELSRRHFTPIRQLERLFSLHLGISPKEFISFTRCQSAITTIRGGHTRKSLLDIACECGYYDHAHLSNEIRRYTGSSPSGV